MWQLVLLVVAVGVGIWLMKRGGCCGMGKREDRDDSQDKGSNCH